MESFHVIFLEGLMRSINSDVAKQPVNGLIALMKLKYHGYYATEGGPLNPKEIERERVIE